ncbi:putative large ATP-binding protein [Geitlerinema sp. FC II]|nr:putative large ATP-binding protein [Geitlerinema sp. FC II]
MVQQDESTEVRKTAVLFISKNLKEDPKIQYLLLEWEQQSQCSYVRAASVSSLARYFKEQPEVYPLLINRVQTDEAPTVRKAAVYALAQYFKEEPETYSLLIDRVRQDQSVCLAAISVLAKYFQEKPETLPLFVERLRQDERYYVRSTALKAIAYTQAPTPQTFDLLCDVARHDPFVREYDTHTNPRQTALELLLDRFPNKLLETVILLRDRAQNDPDEKLQNWAQEKLSELDTKSA